METIMYTVTALRGGVKHTLCRAAENEDALRAAMKQEGYEVIDIRYATVKDISSYLSIGPNPPRDFYKKRREREREERINTLLYELIGDFCKREDKTIEEKIIYLIEKKYSLPDNEEEVLIKINNMLDELYTAKYNT